MSQMLKSPARYVQGKGVLKELDRYLHGLGNHLMILQTAGGMRRNKSMLDNCFQGKEFIVDYEAFSGECTRAKIEAWAAQWLAENPGKTRLDVPPAVARCWIPPRASPTTRACPW